MNRSTLHNLTLILLHAINAVSADVLIPQLADDRFVVREQAQLRLFELEEDALPAIRSGLNNPDPEIRDRCRQALMSYYDVFDAHPFISIYQIPDKAAAQKYWEGTWRRPDIFSSNIAESIAFQNYVLDLMEGGMTRRKALEFVDECAKSPAEK